METTLNTLKNNYAQEQGYEDWSQLYEESGRYDETIFFNHENAVFILAQEAALEKAAEIAKIIKTGNSGSYFDASIDRESITNPENLIR